jgi:hypothetical protein
VINWLFIPTPVEGLRFDFFPEEDDAEHHLALGMEILVVGCMMG